MLVGTERGAIECRTFTRLPAGERWNVEMTKQMKGLPREPVPGKQSHHILVAIEEDGAVMGEEAEDLESRPTANDEEDAGERRYMKNPDQLHVSKKAIAKLGTTDGCAGCGAIVGRGHLPGRFGCNHSTKCRTR